MIGKQRQTATESKVNYTVPVVRSTFRILEELSRAQALGLSEITQRTGVAKSTVFRILSTLLEMGYVIRDSGRNYLVSFSLAGLVSEDASSEALRRLVLPHMLDLRNDYGETVNLGIRHFDKVTYLEVVPSEFALRLEDRRGASILVHASALGKAILAFSPPDLVESLFRGRTLAMVTQNTICNAEDLIAEMKRVRAAGFAMDRGEGSLLATCVGAPILDSHGIAVAAMSISGPASRFNPRKDSPVVGSLLEATAAISRHFAQMLSGREPANRDTSRPQ